MVQKRTPDNSRARLLAAGKSLFARLGYEFTSTATIARDAGTSESQLVRYFGSKAGLLETIFEEAWRPLNSRVHDLLADAPRGRDAVEGVLSAVLSAFEHDDELATIFLFEGRRIRSDAEVKVSAGYIEFQDIIHRLIKRGQKDGSFASTFDGAALAAALMGGAEAMVRERLLARRGGGRAYSDKQVHKIFSAMLDGFQP